MIVVCSVYIAWWPVVVVVVLGGVVAWRPVLVVGCRFLGPSTSRARKTEKDLFVSLLLDGRAEDRTQPLETCLALEERSISSFFDCSTKRAVVAGSTSQDHSCLDVSIN